MAEQFGCKVLVTAQDVWPDMQGSVLVVTEDLIRAHPDIVGKLVNVTQQATAWINRHPDKASAIVASRLNASGCRIFPEKTARLNSCFHTTPDVVRASLAKGLLCTTDIRLSDIETAMAYMDGLGYLRRKISPAVMLDRRWLVQ